MVLDGCLRRGLLEEKKKVVSGLGIFMLLT